MENGVRSVCFRGDFAIKHTNWIPSLKLVWKCVTHWSISFICNSFSCWLVLLSIFSLFWDYIPESEVYFCINLRRPSGPHAIWRIQKLLNRQTTRWVPLDSSRRRTTKNRRCGSEFAKWNDIYIPEECEDEWRQNNADLKLLCHEWFHHHVRYHVHDGHCSGEFATVICVYTVSQSRSVVTSAENPASENPPRSIGDLHNGHVVNLRKLLCQPGSKNCVK